LCTRGTCAANCAIPHRVGEAGFEPAGVASFEFAAYAILLPARSAPPGTRTRIPRIKSPVHSRTCSQRMERMTGIGPALTAWKAVALPLCYIRISLGRPR
jgi:hypothetical protein